MSSDPRKASNSIGYKNNWSSDKDDNKKGSSSKKKDDNNKKDNNKKKPNAQSGLSYSNL